jgi:A nuclease family of the HNH/ENDO VII superfamily with conserved AHH
MVRMDAWRRRLAVLCLLVAVGVAVVAASASGSAETSVWDVPAAAGPDPSTWASDPVWQRAHADAAAREAARQAAINAPGADAERERSATQFDDLSRPEAQDLAQQTFPDLMAAPVDALGLPDGDHVTSYLSPTQARVEDEHGKDFILMGTEPFAARDDGESRLTKVDLSLSAQDGALVPDNPSVDVQLPDSASDPLTLPNTGLSVSMGEGADVAGRVEDDRVFYGDVLTDTDYITVPRRQGAEVMWQLRSSQATESPSLDLDLPVGQHARLTSALTGDGDGTNPSVQIVNDDNTVMDTIGAPTALDADGVSVPAHYRLDGDRVYVDVPHREQAVRYPVIVDPPVNEVWGGNDWQGYGAGLAQNVAGRWTFFPTDSLGTRWWLYNNTLWGQGLYIQSAPGNYAQGQYAEFTWSTPPNVAIANVWFDGFYHQTEGDELFAGIYNPGGWETLYTHTNADITYGQSNQTPAYPFDGSSVAFGVWEDQTISHPVPGWVGVRGVNILLADTHPPDDVHIVYAHYNGQDFGYIPDDGTPAHLTWLPWVNATTFTTPAGVEWETLAHDYGLGLQHVGLMDNNNNWIGNAGHASCTGTRSSPCPSSIVWKQSIPLRLGYTDIRPVGIPVTGTETFGPKYRLRVDGDSPKITLSGDTVDHRTDGTLGYNPTVTIDAKDDGSSSAGAADHQSGVSQVILSLDSPTNHIYTWNRPAGCNDDCDAHWNATLPVTSPGEHRLWVVATDGSNHSGNYSDPNNPGNNFLTFTVRTDTSWIYGGANHAVDDPAEAEVVGSLLTGSNYWSVWNGLSTDDKNFMLGAVESHFAAWAPRIDTSPPAPPAGIRISDVDNAARTAEIVWSAGTDPDVSSGVYGTQGDGDASQYRYRRSGGDWTSWMTSDEEGFRLAAADAGDGIDVQAREADAAGNWSSTSTVTLQVPRDPTVSHFVFLGVAVVECIEWCPVAAAGGYAAGRWFWSVNQNHYNWDEVGSQSDVAVTPSTDHSETFEEAERRSKRSRSDDFANQGKIKAKRDGESTIGKSAHHVIAKGARIARYARWVLYRCGVDPTNFDSNGAWIPTKYHNRMHTTAYYEGVNRFLEKYDPTFGSDPCGENEGEDAGFGGEGLKRAIQDMIKYLMEGKMPQ